MPTGGTCGRGLDVLSSIEMALLRLLVAGESQRSIMNKLRLEEREAARVRQSLMTKLKARATADAVRVGTYAQLPV